LVFAAAQLAIVALGMMPQSWFRSLLPSRLGAR
jgi:hypothetical protein